MKSTEQILTEVGFLAAGNGDYRETMAIVEGLKKHSPHSTAAYFIHAFLELNRANYEQALEILLQAQTLDADNPALNAYLGLTQQLMGQHSDSHNPLTTAANSHDPAVVSLAHNLLTQPLTINH